MAVSSLGVKRHFLDHIDCTDLHLLRDTCRCRPGSGMYRVISYVACPGM